MDVRAKFKCQSVRKTYTTIWNGNEHSQGFLYDFEFGVVNGDSEENKQFFASTPSGSIKLASVRDDLFEPGKEYYLDFKEAE